MHVKIPLGKPVGARSQSGFLGVKIALDNHTKGQLRRGRLGTCSGAFNGRVNAKLGLSKTSARRLAGSFNPYLASVAENFATLLQPDPYCTIQRLESPRRRTPKPGRSSSHST
jgi:hypothetical protein